MGCHRAKSTSTLFRPCAEVKGGDNTLLWSSVQKSYRIESVRSAKLGHFSLHAYRFHFHRNRTHCRMRSDSASIAVAASDDDNSLHAARSSTRVRQGHAISRWKARPELLAESRTI